MHLLPATGAGELRPNRRADEWERLGAPVCDRCLLLLRTAGDKGRRLKAETWWLGHGHGLYAAPQGHY